MSAEEALAELADRLSAGDAACDAAAAEHVCQLLPGARQAGLACAALLASGGDAATRAVLRLRAASAAVASLLEDPAAQLSTPCLVLWYLTQDGAAAQLLALPGVAAGLSRALLAACGDEEDELAAAAAGAAAHLVTAQPSALVPCVTAAAQLLACRPSSLPAARYLSGLLGSAGPLSDAQPAALKALGAALQLWRQEAEHAALAASLLGAIVACAAPETQAGALAAADSAAFGLAVSPSLIPGAGDGLFVVSGSAPCGALLAIYPGEMHPPGEAARLAAAGAQYVAAVAGGGCVDGDAAAVLRVCAVSLPPRLQAQRANHPPPGVGPNALFVQLELPAEVMQTLPVSCAGSGALPSWCLGLMAVECLGAGTEVLVDYGLAAGEAPAWYRSVKPRLTL